MGFLLACACLGCAHAEPEGERSQRIVSMAPSTTEILFALGLGDQVVGVSRYCDYPDAAGKIVKVGGHVDPNYEAIVAARPDLVILLTAHRDVKTELDKLGIRTLVTPHKSVGDIHEAIRLIGDACDRRQRADTLLDQLARRTQAVREAVEGRPRPRVLICIGRDTESEQLSGIYVPGRHEFYDEIIEMAGGVNAYEGEQVAYPEISAEGVLQINPDVIIDLADYTHTGEKTPAEIEAQWSALRTVGAVRDGRVHAITGTHAMRPGPRYVEFLEQLARLLHPDAFHEGH